MKANFSLRNHSLEKDLNEKNFFRKNQNNSENKELYFYEKMQVFQLQRILKVEKRHEIAKICIKQFSEIVLCHFKRSFMDPFLIRKSERRMICSDCL